MVYTTAYVHTEDNTVLVGVVVDTSLSVEVTHNQRLELSLSVLQG
jgi:hypothetical protein